MTTLIRRNRTGVGWETVEDTGGGGGGVEVQGPFPVAFDTPGIDVADYPGAPIAPLATGQWLLDVWVKIITDFDAGTLFLATSGVSSVSDIVGFGWDVTGNPDTAADLAQQAGLGADADVTLRLTGARNQSDSIRALPAEVLVDCDMTAYMDFGGPPASQGLVHVYALVWTPA